MSCDLGVGQRVGWPTCDSAEPSNLGLTDGQFRRLPKSIPWILTTKYTTMSLEMANLQLSRTIQMEAQHNWPSGFCHQMIAKPVLVSCVYDLIVANYLVFFLGESPLIVPCLTPKHSLRAVQIPRASISAHTIVYTGNHSVLSKNQCFSWVARRLVDMEKPLKSVGHVHRTTRLKQLWPRQCIN
ncbi:hypothetical protein BD779DRAFT_1492995 [Infundibulicybe gibba]|nr:hypothetical protein BD779DRAFT_1492995 [Infundibulicybe gibba]